MSSATQQRDKICIAGTVAQPGIAVPTAIGLADLNGAASPKLLTLKEFSDFSKLSPATIHRLKRQGKILFFQPSGPRGKLLFPADAVEQAAKAASNDSVPASPGTVRTKAHLSGPCPAWMKS